VPKGFGYSLFFRKVLLHGKLYTGNKTFKILFKLNFINGIGLFQIAETKRERQKPEKEKQNECRRQMNSKSYRPHALSLSVLEVKNGIERIKTIDS